MDLNTLTSAFSLPAAATPFQMSAPPVLTESSPESASTPPATPTSTPPPTPTSTAPAQGDDPLTEALLAAMVQDTQDTAAQAQAQAAAQRLALQESAWATQQGKCHLTGLAFQESGDLAPWWLETDGVWVLEVAARLKQDLPMSIFVSLCTRVAQQFAPKPAPVLSVIPGRQQYQAGPQQVQAPQAVQPVFQGQMPRQVIAPPVPQAQAVQPDPNAALGWTYDPARQAMVNTRTGEVMR